MDAEEFRRRGKEMIDFVADYLESSRDRPAHPPQSEIQPGYLAPMLPKEAPQEPETFEAIMADVNRVVLPGVTNWHSPNFFAYFPAANSYAGICADILSDAIGCIGFTWSSSPSCTELETVMMDWLAKMLQLPSHFLFESKGKGGGVIHGTASEATLLAMLTARNQTISDRQEKSPNLTTGNILDRLTIFSSDQAHSGVERAGLFCALRNRITVPSDDNNVMTGDALKNAIDKAVAEGQIPFFVVATLGTTNTCAFDKLLEIGQVIEEYNRNADSPIWLHIDAAYAGSAFICPEYRPLLNGIEYANSFVFNPHKWLLVNFDCSAMWFKDATPMINAFNVDPIYLKHHFQGKSVVPDYRHWQIPLGRRFRSLKLFFVLRLYGVRQLQQHIRRQIDQARYFESLMRTDDRFEITDVAMGLICFRLKSTGSIEDGNAVNESLFKAIESDNRIHIVPGKVKGKFTLRFAICATRTTNEDVEHGWKVIKELATLVYQNQKVMTTGSSSAENA